MPQEHNVLKCYTCETFQVHIVKKAKKWECKICNEKQSIRKVYGQGSGKDCRLHVQKLNSLRMQRDQDDLYSSVATCLDTNENSEPSFQAVHQDQPFSALEQRSCETKTLGVSKWDQFVEKPIEQEENNSGDSDVDLTSVGRKLPRVGKGLVGRKSKVSKLSVKGQQANCGKWGEFIDVPLYSEENDQPLNNCSVNEVNVKFDSRNIECNSVPLSRGAVSNKMYGSVDVRSGSSGGKGGCFIVEPRFSAGNTSGDFYLDSPHCTEQNASSSDRSTRVFGASSNKRRGKWDEFLDDPENSQECYLPTNKTLVVGNGNPRSVSITHDAVHSPLLFTSNLYNDDDLDDVLKF